MSLALRNATGSGAAVTRNVLPDRRNAHMVAVNELAIAADVHALSACSIPFLMIKGPILANMYDDPSVRQYGDLDIVVRPTDVRSAIDAITVAGGRLLDANWSTASRERWGQVHILMPYGSLVDLHWHLINAGRVRDTLAVDMAHAWDDVRWVDVPGGMVRTMSVTNTAVHLALHAALGGAWQRQWFHDVRALSAAEPVVWQDVVARAKDWKASRLVGVALQRARTLAGADVPAAAVNALLGRLLTPSVISLLDRRWPPLDAERDWSPARLWPHLVRDTWRDGMRAAAWRIERRVRNGPAGFWHGRTLPREMEPTGGPGACEAFLRQVEIGAWY